MGGWRWEKEGSLGGVKKRRRRETRRGGGRRFRDGEMEGKDKMGPRPGFGGFGGVWFSHLAPICERKSPGARAVAALHSTVGAR